MQIRILVILILSPFCISAQISNYSLDSTKLIEGNGIISFLATNGDYRGFQTVKDGHLNGDFYWIDTTETYALSGEFKYQPNCLNYFYGISVRFITEFGDTAFLVVDSTFFNQTFKNTSLKILEVKKDSSLPEVAPIHPDLGMGIGDPAVVPIKKWQKTCFKPNCISELIVFDECGNPIEKKYFDFNNNFLRRITFDRKPDRKVYWH